MADSNGTSMAAKVASDKGGGTVRKATFARRNSNSALQGLVDPSEEAHQAEITPCDEDDQDVIDCSTSEIDSDLEIEPVKKSGGKMSSVPETTSAKKSVDTVLPGGFIPTNKSGGQDNSDEEKIEMIIEESPPRETEDTQIIQPTITLGVDTETEGRHLINGPLRKEIIEQIAISDDEDDLKMPSTSQESLNLQIDWCVNKASEAISKRQAIDSGGAHSSKLENVTDNVHDNDDSKINEIQMDMYQNFGDLDYEPDDDEHRTSVRVKKEPGTVAERMQGLNLAPGDIPIIDLLSSDEEPPGDTVEPATVKSAKKRNRKKRTSNNDECQPLKPISSEESFTPSEKSLTSMSSGFSLDELHSGDRRMSLRKRTITILPGAVLSTSGRKSKMRKLFNDTESINEALKKSVCRTGSKCSLASTESSVGDDQIPVSNKLQVDSEDAKAEEARTEQKDKSSKQSKRKQSTESFDLEQAIAKELEQGAAQTDDNQKTDVPDIPVATTDIALEDMLGMFEEKEETEKALDPFHSTSVEENIWMESLFTETAEERVSETLGAILDDGQPLDEIQSALDESGVPIVASYTVYSEPDLKNPETAHMAITGAETGEHHIVQESTDEANQKKAQRFKIVQNFHKYPPPKKSAPKSGKQAKVAAATSRPRRKRRESNDSDYLPSYARTRRISIRPRKPPTSRKRDDFVPTGEYLSEDSELLCQSKPPELQPEAPLVEDGAGGTMSMPSLEEDLAMSSSESSTSTTTPLAGSVSNSGSAGLSGCSSLHVPGDGGRQRVDAAEGNGKPGKGKKPLKKPVPGRKRGRPKIHQQQISDYFCPASGDKQETCKASCCQDKPLQKDKAKAVAKPVVAKAANRRKKKLSSSSSEDETESMSFSGASTATNSTSISTAGEDDTLQDVESSDSTESSPNSKAVAAAKDMDNLQIVLSPLTAEQIRIINTPSKKSHKLSKTTQTEIGGLTVKIPWERINFNSKYFVNLRLLLSAGSNRDITDQVASSSGRVQRRLENNFELVTMPNRTAGADSPSPPPPPNPVPRAFRNDRSTIDNLLYNISNDEIQLPPTSNSEDRQSSVQITKSFNSNFRIPKLCKQPSTSPEIVTSSTSHGNEKQEGEKSAAPPITPQHSSEELTAGSGGHGMPAANRDGGYSNDESDEGVRVSPLRFAQALNSGYRPVVRKEGDPRSVGQSYVRSGLPDRADLVNVKRTIQNDMPQIQQQQQRAMSADIMFRAPIGFPSSGTSFEPPQYGASTSSSFNRGYMGFPGAPINNAAPPMYGIDVPRFLEMWMLSVAQQQQQQQAIFAQSPAIGHPFAGQVLLPNQPSCSRPPTQPMYSQQMGLPASIPSAEQLLSSGDNMEMVTYLFGCQDFLMGGCNNPDCRRSHMLPSEAEVRQKLLSQNQDFIMITYKFVASRDDLFNRYFPVYANVMGKNRMRHQLRNTIADCEQHNRKIEYYRNVVDGLIMSDLNTSNAVQIVLESHTKKSFHQINVLVDLIIRTGDGIPKFVQKLNEFLQVRGYVYEITAVNALIDACIRFERPPNDLQRFVAKLVLNVPDACVESVNLLPLIDFVKKARQDPDLTLDIDDITKKYGNIVVR